MVYQTIRDFLLRSYVNSEFLIDRKTGYKRLAMTCLQYLSSDEMKGPRLRKLSVSRGVKSRSAFALYVSTSLFEYINNIASTDDEFFLTLVNFLISSNVLS